MSRFFVMVRWLPFSDPGKLGKEAEAEADHRG